MSVVIMIIIMITRQADVPLLSSRKHLVGPTNQHFGDNIDHFKIQTTPC